MWPDPIFSGWCLLIFMKRILPLKFQATYALEKLRMIASKLIIYLIHAKTAKLYKRVWPSKVWVKIVVKLKVVAMKWLQ